MPLLDFGKSLAKPQAIKTSVSEAAGRKIDKMFDNAAKPKINVSKTPAKPMAVKVEGKRGPADRRSATGSRARKPDTGGQRTDDARAKRAEVMKKAEGRMKPLPTTQAQRGEIVRSHFKNILSGKTGRMQGNK
jgi:hypothetical protein